MNFLRLQGFADLNKSAVRAFWRTHNISDRIWEQAESPGRPCGILSRRHNWKRCCPVAGFKFMENGTRELSNMMAHGRVWLQLSGTPGLPGRIHNNF